MSRKNNGVQKLIRDDYPFAFYTHCYAHQFNLVLERASNHNREVRIFWSNISGFSSFFSHSSQRVSVLDRVLGRRLPSGSATRWNFHSPAILTIHENKEKLLECFKKVERTSTQPKTINEASGLRLQMKKRSFNFWLEFFSKIMPH